MAVSLFPSHLTDLIMSFELFSAPGFGIPVTEELCIVCSAARDPSLRSWILCAGICPAPLWLLQSQEPGAQVAVWQLSSGTASVCALQ